MLARTGCALTSGRRSGGFTYLGLLIAIALIGIGLAVVSEVWVKVAERQKLAQLEWIGQQYVQAIGSYYYANTGSVHYYPQTLEDLLEDKRHLGIIRHIREIYANPFTGKVDFKLSVAPSGGVQGIEAATTPDGISKTYVFVPPQAAQP